MRCFTSALRRRRLLLLLPIYLFILGSVELTEFVLFFEFSMSFFQDTFTRWRRALQGSWNLTKAARRDLARDLASLEP